MKILHAAVNSLVAGLPMVIATCSVQAADWSVTEVHLQYGNLDKAFQGGKGSAETDGTFITTFQHASGWKYGDNFFFVDHLNYGGRTDFEKSVDPDTGRVRRDTSDDEWYGEWYPTFSFSKISGHELELGFLKDIALIAGFNFASEVDTFYYLPGVRFDLNVPGFAFAHLDITAYIPDGSKNVGVGIQEGDSFMVDFNWAYPFKIANTSWSLEGHIEYIDGADQEIGGVKIADRESWILAQPQLRLDLGEIILSEANQLFIGVEYQYWRNKLGDKETDESAPQFLAVWRF